jgi:hypothetical protein
MKALFRCTISLTMLAGCCSIGVAASAQEAPAGYVTPAQSVQTRGSAPGMQVKLISNGGGPKER